MFLLENILASDVHFPAAFRIGNSNLFYIILLSIKYFLGKLAGKLITTKDKITFRSKSGNRVLRQDIV